MKKVMQNAVLILYIMGSLCFLAGSVLSLIRAWRTQ